MNKVKNIALATAFGALAALCWGCQYNQQQPVQYVKPMPTAIELGRLQTPATWQQHSLYGSAFTISIPGTMEQSSPNDRWSQQLSNQGIRRAPRVVIFQQRSLNNGNIEHADDHYCRVLINYETSDAGEFLHAFETEELDAFASAYLLENVKSNIDQSQQLLGHPSIDWVDIDGTKAIRVRYRRTGNNGNTTACTMYYLFNYDEEALVMTAYREQEASLWQSDMENVIRTFRWSRCK